MAFLNSSLLVDLLLIRRLLDAELGAATATLARLIPAACERALLLLTRLRNGVFAVPRVVGVVLVEQRQAAGGLSLRDPVETADVLALIQL